MAQPRGPRRIPASVWAKLVALAAGSVVLMMIAPRAVDGSGTQPPVAFLLFVGLLLIFAASAAVYLAVHRDLGFPALVAWYAVGFNALVILVKFVFGPFGLYEVNQSVDFESILGPMSRPGVAVATAITVLVLYVLAYLGLYRFVVRKEGPGLVARLRAKVVKSRRAVLFIVGGAILVAAGGGAGIFLITLVLASSGLQYIDFVFSSSASLMVAMFLAAATILAGLHFREGGTHSKLVADAAGIASLFWLGLCFIALYHALWVVYILVLTSIWPLRTVVPK